MPKNPSKGSTAENGTARFYVCKTCGYSPDNRATWCALGCGSDYNEMIPVPPPPTAQTGATTR